MIVILNIFPTILVLTRVLVFTGLAFLIYKMMKFAVNHGIGAERSDRVITGNNYRSIENIWKIVRNRGKNEKKLAEELLKFGMKNDLKMEAIAPVPEHPYDEKNWTGKYMEREILIKSTIKPGETNLTITIPCNNPDAISMEITKLNNQRILIDNDEIREDLLTELEQPILRYSRRENFKIMKLENQELSMTFREIKHPNQLMSTLTNYLHLLKIISEQIEKISTERHGSHSFWEDNSAGTANENVE